MSNIFSYLLAKRLNLKGYFKGGICSFAEISDNVGICLPFTLGQIENVDDSFDKGTL